MLYHRDYSWNNMLILWIDLDLPCIPCTNGNFDLDCIRWSSLIWVLFDFDELVNYTFTSRKQEQNIKIKVSGIRKYDRSLESKIKVQSHDWRVLRGKNESPIWFVWLWLASQWGLEFACPTVFGAFIWVVHKRQPDFNSNSFSFGCRQPFKKYSN